MQQYKSKLESNWRLLFTPNEDPYMNMAIDEALASECADSTGGLSTIRFYTWKEPSCSIGYFQKMETVFATLKENEIPIVRRPTGGGIVFHGNDITFSIVRKRVRDKRLEDISSFYKLIGESILVGLKKLGFTCSFYIPEKAEPLSESGKKYLKPYSTQKSICSVTHAKYDILINGGKVAGYAARRSRDAILCQGYLDVYEIWKDRHNNTGNEMIDLLYGDLVNSFKKVFGITLTYAPLTVEEKKLAHQIREKKYSCKKWNYRK